jgi:2-polyprenyl-3-methyl-5-hydroxy-6-metoxy-1,4-benzoquinol methylase
MSGSSVDNQRSHPLIQEQHFGSIESYVLHLIHQEAYEEACSYAKGRRVLDWGCNNGYGIEIMRSYAASIAGIDVAPHAVEAGKQRFGPDGPYIELFDGERSSFSDASFDLITSFQLIEHIQDCGQLLGEMARILAPGGLALFTTPNGMQRLNPGLGPWNRFHVREFSPQELRELLETHFESVEVLGLTGDAEILSIERARLDRVKKEQRRKLGPPSKTAVGRLKRRVPPMGDLVGRARRRLSPQRPLSAEQLARFSTRDLVYRADDVDAALDLMAVCRVGA